MVRVVSPEALFKLRSNKSWKDTRAPKFKKNQKGLQKTT